MTKKVIFLKKIKIISIILIVLLLLLSFVGCDDTGFPVDIDGQKINNPPQKIAVLSEQAASAICALGYKDYLSGAPTEFVKANNLNGVADLGESSYIDFEKLCNLKPDIVISPKEIDESNMEKLNLRDIQVIVLSTPTSYLELAPYYKALSKIFLGEKRYVDAYDVFTEENERQIKQMKQQNSLVDAGVVVFVEEDFVVTGDTLAGEALSKIGVNNIAQSGTDYTYSAENIKNADPQIVFCSKNSSEKIINNENYKNLTAVKQGRIYEIDMTALLYGGEGFIVTLQEISNYLAN